jgi:hypothetical protein
MSDINEIIHVALREHECLFIIQGLSAIQDQLANLIDLEGATHFESELEQVDELLNRFYEISDAFDQHVFRLPFP